MESCVIQERECDRVENKKDASDTQSAEDFQKFIYDLFEKNGILNDLRAYLRGHIVGILKTAHTGDPPACQKHFTQRLELTYQALNIVIVEYLLRLDFRYTLSVFLSELPLANMVFRFAKSIMHNVDDVNKGLRFEDCDVWSILNYLGVKCDSEHAANVVDMYRNENASPLLLCILKCMPMYHKDNAEVLSSNVSESSSDTLDGKTKNSHRHTLHEKCKHYLLCKTCQSRINRIKEKYRRRKKDFTKMFQQLKSVYETEMAMVKEEEDKKVKRSLASHAVQLQKRSDQMEASFRAREAQLELGVQQKKRFLWGLARALRDQHQHMAAAMKQVREETRRLELKEDSLKTQLAEAEQVLKQRGEDMRAQVSNELTILEGHIESMKRERDNIIRERSELENLKSEGKCQVAKTDEDNEGLRTHYELLRDELSILKKYVESVKLQPKCFMERGTTTDSDVTAFRFVLNNAQEERERLARNEDRVKANQLVNDLKKQKNVNFSQSNLEEIYHERSRDRSRSSASSEAGDGAGAEPPDDAILRLQHENDALKTFARQQRLQIEELSAARARLQAELTPRPRTAPTLAPHYDYFPQRVNTSASAGPLSFGWRKGAGEELSLFSHAEPRIVVPGDTLPFIGVLRDRHTDPRRHLINQWRALRRRMSPMKTRPRPSALLVDRPGSAGAARSFQYEPRPGSSSEAAREQPDSLLGTISKDKVKDVPDACRERSPGGVLREARLRLRRLEVEAAAVERSYQDFRRRQRRRDSPTRRELPAADDAVSSDIVKELDENRSRIMRQLGETRKETRDEERTNHLTETHNLNNDANRYLREYEVKCDIAETHFRNKNMTAGYIKPIPAGFSIVEGKSAAPTYTDYIETPMDEFRKFYQSDNIRLEDNCPSSANAKFYHSDSNRVDDNRLPSPNSAKTRSRDSSPNNSDNSGQAVFTQRKAAKTKDKREQLEILKQNIGKIYNLPDEAALEESKIVPDLEKQLINEENNEENYINLLRVEVESVSNVNSLQIGDSRTQDLLLVIRSSGDTRDLAASDPEEDPEETRNPGMTIIISPKQTSPQSTRNIEEAKTGMQYEALDQGVRSMQNDAMAAIFNADADNQISCVNLDLELSKDLLEESLSDIEKCAEEYPDDFSADVDNYNSRSEFENNSPISLVKTSEDEHFWDT